MKITNISSKVIGVGRTVLMPDASADIDEKVVNTPAVKSLVDKGFLKAEGEIVVEKNEADIDTSTVTLVMPKYDEEPEEEKPVEKKTKAKGKKKSE
jgi:hypothetical protein